MLIQLGVMSLKKTRFMCLLDLLGKAEKGWCDLVCGAPLDDWANGGCVDFAMW